jgi:hypothetical protein
MVNLSPTLKTCPCVIKLLSVELHSSSENFVNSLILGSVILPLYSNILKISSSDSTPNFNLVRIIESEDNSMDCKVYEVNQSLNTSSLG